MSRSFIALSIIMLANIGATTAPSINRSKVFPWVKQDLSQVNIDPWSPYQDDFIISDRTYSTRIDDVLSKRINENAASFSLPASVCADNCITYRVTHSYDPYGTGCFLRKCLRLEIAKEVE